MDEWMDRWVERWQGMKKKKKDGRWMVGRKAKWMDG